MSRLAANTLAACTVLAAYAVAVVAGDGCLGRPWMPPPTSTDFAPDLDGDCRVTLDDLVVVLAFFGSCEDAAVRCGCGPATYCCRTDLDRDGVTGIEDVVAVLDAMAME